MTRPRRVGGPRTTVLVLGMGASWASHATARSLARAGYRVVGASQGGRLAGRTRYCEQLHLVPPTERQEAFAARIEEICSRERVEVIVPVADHLLGALLCGPAAGGPWAVVGPTAEQFTRMWDKVALLETAAAAGVASPASAVVTAEGPGAPLPPMPAYVKVVTGAEIGRGVERPVRVTSVEECERVVQNVVDRGDVVLVQEEIVGQQLRLQFVRWRGELAHLTARTIANYPFRVGPSTISEFFPSPPELVGLGASLLETVGYDGPGVIQFIERDGVWYVHDINPRMPSSVDASVAAGLDMPRLAVEIALGQRPNLASVRPRSVRQVILDGELLALRDALRGVDVGRSSRDIAVGILAATVLPDRRLTPVDLTDPLPTLAALAAVARRPTSPARRSAPAASSSGSADRPPAKTPVS